MVRCCALRRVLLDAGHQKTTAIRSCLGFLSFLEQQVSEHPGMITPADRSVDTSPSRRRKLRRQIRKAPLSMEDNGASVLLIFQAPGVEKWRRGRPLISQNSFSAGSRMAEAFQRAEQCRRHYNITNTVQCFPGKRPQNSGARPRDNSPPRRGSSPLFELAASTCANGQFRTHSRLGGGRAKRYCGFGVESGE